MKLNFERCVIKKEYKMLEQEPLKNIIRVKLEMFFAKYGIANIRVQRVSPDFWDNPEERKAMLAQYSGSVISENNPFETEGLTFEIHANGNDFNAVELVYNIPSYLRTDIRFAIDETVNEMAEDLNTTKLSVDKTGKIFLKCMVTDNKDFIAFYNVRIAQPIEGEI